ncbi:MAG TPA: hypothetical protein VFT91_11050 [Dehalococcoidia bacterium]|nr:hypothetical protein [Dehalococcoidia bacterium]
MIAVLTLAAALLAAPPDAPAPKRAALVFMQVESPAEPAAKALLGESLRHAFAARMAVITCKEATEDESTLLKALQERDIKQSSDAPDKVKLLAKLSKYSCKLPEDADLWAAWLTAYADSRSGRREVSLRMRNLNDEEAKPSFASFAEPADTHLSWSEMVERCVQRYFGDWEPGQLKVVPVVRIGVGVSFPLQAQLSLSTRARTEALRDQVSLSISWQMYGCTSRAPCDAFRAALDEYANCRRANRLRSASDPSPVPLCHDPSEDYDHLSVTPLPRDTRWLRWEASSDRLSVDVPGEYLLVARAAAADDLIGTQRLSVEPPPNIVVAFGGLAYKPTDAVLLLGYNRVVAVTSLGVIGLGLEWGARLGAPRDPPPPFGIRGLVAPSVMVRRYFTSDLVVESWLAPLGLLYEFDPEEGYHLKPGTMLGLAVVWRPHQVPVVSLRAGLMGITQATSLQKSELYGPLVGGSFEF